MTAPDIRTIRVSRSLRQQDDLTKTPLGMFGIEADEATDTSNESIIITFIPSVNNVAVCAA